MALEAGKPIRDSRLEAGRAVNTFKIAAEEAKRIGGELIPLDWAPGHEGRLGITPKVPHRARRWDLPFQLSPQPGGPQGGPPPWRPETLS